MTTDHELREALISVFEHLMQQNSVLHDLMNEIASVRDALIEIGPKYEEILTRHRVRRARETKPFAAVDFQKFEKII